MCSKTLIIIGCLGDLTVVSFLKVWSYWIWKKEICLEWCTEWWSRWWWRSWFWQRISHQLWGRWCCATDQWTRSGFDLVCAGTLLLIQAYRLIDIKFSIFILPFLNYFVKNTVKKQCRKSAILFYICLYLKIIWHFFDKTNFG